MHPVSQRIVRQSFGQVYPSRAGAVAGPAQTAQGFIPKADMPQDGDACANISSRNDAFQNLATGHSRSRCQSPWGRLPPSARDLAPVSIGTDGQGRRQKPNFSTAQFAIVSPARDAHGPQAAPVFADLPDHRPYLGVAAGYDKCLAFFGATHIPSKPEPAGKARHAQPRPRRCHRAMRRIQACAARARHRAAVGWPNRTCPKAIITGL